MNLSVFSIPREKSTRGAGPQKEVDVLAHPPPGVGVGSGVAVGWRERRGEVWDSLEVSWPHPRRLCPPPTPLLCLSCWRCL